MKRILLLLTGAIREQDCTKATKETYIRFVNNIQTLQKCLPDSVHTVLATWKSSESKFDHFGKNYYYEYNEDEMKSYLSTCIDQLILQDSPDFSRLPMNRCSTPPTHMYHLAQLAEQFRDYSYEYVVWSRLENLVCINNLERYLTDKIYTLPLLWFWEKPFHTEKLNDHFFIMPFKTFTSLTHQTYQQFVNDTSDNESTFTGMLKSLGTVEVIQTTQEFVCRIGHYIRGGKHFIKFGLRGEWQIDPPN